MAYTYEAPFVDPYVEDAKKSSETVVKKPKRKSHEESR